MAKDWTGNNKAVYACLGASNHVNDERQGEDYYATHPSAAKFLLELVPELNNIWECACGSGHLAKVFHASDKLASATDLVDRGYGSAGYDFLREEPWVWDGDIVTNPPYKFAQQFVEKALEAITEDRYVCMFLKLTFLEGKARKKLFEKYPPKCLFVSSSRIPCAKDGNFDDYPSSAIAYGWFVWQKGYDGDTIIKWFN